MRTINIGNSVFTNVALTEDGDVWWEGLENPPAHATSWKGEPWTPDSEELSSHPNSRYCTPIKQCPILAPEYDDPRGVPIDAILFGGRRKTTIPLVTEARDWVHGTFMGATLSSETTAAATGQVGVVRRDPMAMLPFIGYNAGDYFGHWINMGKQNDAAKMPRIFYVNWFRRDEDGGFLWPGFGENSRVLKWIIDRIEGQAAAVETPIGHVPAPGSLDIDGLDVTEEHLQKALKVDVEEWKAEIPQITEWFEKFGEQLPGRAVDRARRAQGAPRRLSGDRSRRVVSTDRSLFDHRVTLFRPGPAPEGCGSRAFPDMMTCMNMHTGPARRALLEGAGGDHLPRGRRVRGPGRRRPALRPGHEDHEAGPRAAARPRACCGRRSPAAGSRSIPRPHSRAWWRRWAVRSPSCSRSRPRGPTPSPRWPRRSVVRRSGDEPASSEIRGLPNINRFLESAVDDAERRAAHRPAGGRAQRGDPRSRRSTATCAPSSAGCTCARSTSTPPGARKATRDYVNLMLAHGAKVRTLDEFFNRLIVIDRRLAVVPGRRRPTSRSRSREEPGRPTSPTSSTGPGSGHGSTTSEAGPPTATSPPRCDS